MSGSTNGALIKNPLNHWFYTTDVFWTGELSTVSLNGAIVSFLVNVFTEYTHLAPFWFCLPRSDGDLNEALIAKEIEPFGGTLDDVHNGRVIVASLSQRNPIFQRADVQARCVLLLPQDDGIFKEGLETFMRPRRTLSWDARRANVFWRGSCSADYKNGEFLRRDVVAKLIEHPQCDVKLLKHWHEGKVIPEVFFGEYIPLTQFLSYKMLLIIDGNGISSSHSWVFGSGAVPLMISNCDFWFRPYLVPYQNYVPVKYDLSDLVEKIDWVLSHEEEAKKIVEGALTLSQMVFTPEFQQNYIRSKLLEIR